MSGNVHILNHAVQEQKQLLEAFKRASQALDGFDLGEFKQRSGHQVWNYIEKISKPVLAQIPFDLKNNYQDNSIIHEDFSKVVNNLILKMSANFEFVEAEDKNFISDIIFSHKIELENLLQNTASQYQLLPRSYMKKFG